MSLPVETLDDVRELYSPDTVVHTIPKDAVFAAGRVLAATGCSLETGGTTQLAETTPEQPAVGSLEADLLNTGQSNSWVLREGSLTVNGQPFLIATTPNEKPHTPPQFTDKTVFDMLGDVDINMVNGRIALADPATRDKFVAGPHPTRLPDGRQAYLVGIAVWKLPGAQ